MPGEDWVCQWLHPIPCCQETPALHCLLPAAATWSPFHACSASLLRKLSTEPANDESGAVLLLPLTAAVWMYTHQTQQPASDTALVPTISQADS